MNQRKESFFSLNCLFCFFVVLVINAFLIGCVQTGKQSQTLQTIKQEGVPVDVSGKNFERGLAVVYFDNKFRHIKEMPKSEGSVAKFGRPGAPILKLDHQFGKGEIFESGKKEAVGMLMRGYIHLDRPGKYLFQALSNDGFELYIDGNLIVSDPKVHGDRLSEAGQFNVERGGMFPVEIKYFQRKGTATLRLFWQPSGASMYTIIPGSVYSHLAE